MVQFVYSCGSNGQFQLGTGHSDDLYKPVRVFTTEIGVKQIACGGNHTFILLDNGELYTAGSNNYGQLGVSGAESVPNFVHVDQKHGSKWRIVSAGYEYSVLVNESNEVYTCGFGPKGELGQGAGIKKSGELRKVEFDWSATIIDVKSCLDHTVVLLENHELYGFGNGGSGKLGEPTEKRITSPRLIKLDIDASRVEVGREFTAVSDGETICFLGRDRFDIAKSIPTKSNDFKAMWSSLHFISDNEKVISVGNYSHSQTSVDPGTGYEILEVGSEHGLIYRDNKVWSWGWGEHGNCGPQKQDSVTFDQLTQLFETPASEKVVLLKGGCATTWIVTETLNT